MRSLIFDADVATARAVANGEQCVEGCGESFVEAHQEPVACGYCWRRLPIEDRARVRRAWLDEAGRKAWERIGRERKQRRARQ